MPRQKEHKVVKARQTWVSKDDQAKVLETVTMVVKPCDRLFIKIFPDFTEAVLQAIRDKKMAGAEDLIFYFMSRLMHVRVNGSEHEIGITATAEEIADELNKSVRAVRKNLRTLISLGFIRQSTKRLPTYTVPPEFIYRGTLKILRQREAQQGGKSMDQVFREMQQQRPKKS
jgi:hypothetical protein